MKIEVKYSAEYGWTLLCNDRGMAYLSEDEAEEILKSGVVRLPLRRRMMELAVMGVVEDGRLCSLCWKYKNDPMAGHTNTSVSPALGADLPHHYTPVEETGIKREI